jgi:hypothetical protein
MTKGIRAFVAAAAVMAGGAPGVAHHSLTPFDETRSVTLQGVVTSVEWTNPHVYLHLDVTAKDGAIEAWTLEALPPGTLRRNGLRSGMLPKGEAVTILGFPARDGSHLAFLRKITFADGRDVVVWIGDARPPR